MVFTGNMFSGSRYSKKITYLLKMFEFATLLSQEPLIQHKWLHQFYIFHLKDHSVW